MLSVLLVATIVVITGSTRGISAITCYMCDTQKTGVTTVVPTAFRNQKTCANPDAASLSKFAVDCDSFHVNFTSCESGFTFATDGKTVIRTYRDCMNADGRAKVRIQDGLCHTYSYPPGLQYVCACSGDKCNSENGVGSTSAEHSLLYGTVNGLSAALLEAEIEVTKDNVHKADLDRSIMKAALKFENSTANVTILTAQKVVLEATLANKTALVLVAFNKVNATGDPKNRAAWGNAEAEKNAADKALTAKVFELTEAQETMRIAKDAAERAIQDEEDWKKGKADKRAAYKAAADAAFKIATAKIPGEPLNMFRQILDVALTRIDNQTSW
ncbi:hypothetical protein RvY_11681-2 [Ramazzottius varieornatus]|uniref:Protein quiver n=1 Tax=Ramazzottius varieornatus TaxID=947166 RepID=A0A1D1VGW8_RAMVA|nr:hypothetical protein RvY_11681-2 [Ramazzottius varieornatus]